MNNENEDLSAPGALRNAYLSGPQPRREPPPVHAFLKRVLDRFAQDQNRDYIEIPVVSFDAVKETTTAEIIANMNKEGFPTEMTLENNYRIHRPEPPATAGDYSDLVSAS